MAKELLKPTEKAIKLIKELEGLKLKAYQDYGGVWTIGWGHTRTAKPNMVITKEEAEKLLQDDIERVALIINQLVRVPLNQNQFDALTSFVFNVGVLNFRKSTILLLLNQGKYEAASNELLKWTKAKDPKTGQYVELKGLVRRRKKEKELFDAKI